MSSTPEFFSAISTALCLSYRIFFISPKSFPRVGIAEDPPGRVVASRTADIAGSHALFQAGHPRKITVKRKPPFEFVTRSSCIDGAHPYGSHSCILPSRMANEPSSPNLDHWYAHPAGQLSSTLPPLFSLPSLHGLRVHSGTRSRVPSARPAVS